MSAKKLSREFYERADVVTVARDLLGKILVTRIDGVFTTSLITEVEAYSGRNDKACHAHNGLRTARTEVMYHQGGTAYVYFVYGMHHLFNVVTNRPGIADAVLVRAVQPLEGPEYMLQRRKRAKEDKLLTSGPATLCQALGIKTKAHYGLDLLGDTIWIEEAAGLALHEIMVSTRIGVEYAEEHALKPWRFYKAGTPWVSKKLKGDQLLSDYEPSDWAG